MAEALGIEATDITYKKYYAEYCAMHNLGTPKHKTERCTDSNGKTGTEDQQLNNLLPNQESQTFIGNHRNENGRSYFNPDNYMIIHYKDCIKYVLAIFILSLFSRCV